MATEEPIVATESVDPETDAEETVAAEVKPPVEAAEGKTKKARKTPAKGKPSSRLHRPYFEMIKEAIVSLKERNGSSHFAIAKFIEEKNKNLPPVFKKILSIQLKRFVAGGKLVKVKASYKLPVANAPAKKKPAAKPKAVAKPKPAAKKAPAKKKATAKPKPAPKAKTVVKPKAAAKPKPAAKAVKPKAKTAAKPAKVARKSTRSTPGKKAAAKKAPVKKAAAAKKGKK